MFVIIMAGMSLTFGAAPPRPSIRPRPGRIAALVEQLGDDSFDKREAASKALADVGKPAVRPLMKAIASSSDLEIRCRADRVIQAIAARIPGLVQKGEELHRIGW